jgi:hypothetical protein
MLKPLPMRYGQRVNRACGWKGQVWQGRFFSSPLDGCLLMGSDPLCIEHDPVRAKRVLKAEEYP